MKTHKVLAVAALAAASGAFAHSELQIDVNSLTASFSGGAGFGLGATGTVSFSHDLSSVLANVAIDGVSLGPVGASLASFSGALHLVGGGVTGGFFTISNTDGTSYTASVLGGVGMVTVHAGQGFKIDGITFGGMFGGPSFAGVGVAPWFFSQPLPGTAFALAFSPDAAGRDDDTDVELTAIVPLPQAAGLGFVGLAGLGLRRRR